MAVIRHRQRSPLTCPPGHDALASDLAKFLRSYRQRATWERVEMRRPHDINLRLALLRQQYDMPKGKYGFEADVYSLVMTSKLARTYPTAYEVKVTREDFRREMRDGKWVGMCLCADKAYFAVPEGLVTASEIPDPCGLLVRKSGTLHMSYTWRIAKPAKALNNPVEPAMLLKLAIRPFWPERRG